MKLLSIIASFFIKLGELLGTVSGWLLMICCIMVNFFVDYKLAFVGVVTCIFIDMAVGIWCALKQKKYAKSELMRDTISKLFIYCGALVMIIFMEKLIGFEKSTLTTDICAAVICATELWSIAGNALIINPNLHFFKLIKFALVGEIARKLHITEDDVKETLEKGESLIEKKMEIRRLEEEIKRMEEENK